MDTEQTRGDGEGQGSLGCCSPWGCKELDTTEQLNNNNTYVDAILSIHPTLSFPFCVHKSIFYQDLIFLSREDRDPGFPFQTPPGGQDSPGGEAKDSAFLSSRDTDLLVKIFIWLHWILVAAHKILDL